MVYSCMMVQSRTEVRLCHNTTARIIYLSFHGKWNSGCFFPFLYNLTQIVPKLLPEDH